MKKIRVIISNGNEHAVTDWNARDWYLALKDNDNAFVATSAMLNQLRLGVRLGEIEPFSFLFYDETINCGSKGELDKWPCGFMDHLGISVKALMKCITHDQSKIEWDIFIRR